MPDFTKEGFKKIKTKMQFSDRSAAEKGNFY